MVARGERGNRVILSGVFGGARVAYYLGTERVLGVIIEIFGGTAEDRPQPDESDARRLTQCRAAGRSSRARCWLSRRRNGSGIPRTATRTV